MILLALALAMAGPITLCVMTWLCDWAADRSPVPTSVEPWGSDHE